MFKVTKPGNNRLDIELSGKLEREEMKVALDDLIRQAEGIEHGRMLYRIGDFDMPSLGAMAVELSRLPQLLRFIRRFDRAAVISGTSWIRRVSEVEGALIPGLEIKAFDTHQEQEAEAWLKE